MSNPATRRLLILGGGIAAAAIAIGVVLATRGGDSDPAATTTDPAAVVEPTPGAEVPPPLDPTEVDPPETDPPVAPPEGSENLQTINPNGAPIQSGSEGERVRRLQVALGVFGYEPGTADGAYGPATREAIIAFQEANNLDADGVAGRATIRAINVQIRATA
jgi:peptidoglycan hydrolase-like protein with peptidoglycan-binding domain